MIEIKLGRSKVYKKPELNRADGKPFHCDARKGQGFGAFNAAGEGDTFARAWAWGEHEHAAPDDAGNRRGIGGPGHCNLSL